MRRRFLTQPELDDYNREQALIWKGIAIGVIFAVLVCCGGYEAAQWYFG